MRPVDADALKRTYTQNCDYENCIYEGAFIVNSINEQPTIDAVPVRHGKWIWKGEEGDKRFMCSVCRWKEDVPTCNGIPDIWNYCPNCGAYMKVIEEKKNERY